ncbi:MAG: hydrogenase formation protein HypD [Proteobacteria bacterium]|nr:MAG: hydrogenase formation protein HypD [Pseudomonadota bacterium]
MNFLEEFRNPKHILALSNQIKKEVKTPLKVMEVCGGHTHTIIKYALPQILPKEIEFIHGPGCPVCVMPKERIDQAIALSEQKDVVLATLGDMIRVPGSKSSLQKQRAKGCDVRALYSPLDVLKIAEQNPDKKVVFFAIGFETTTPMTASIINMVVKKKIKNVLFHINHVLVPEILDFLLKDEDTKIDAFLGPSHVSVITGSDIFKPIAEKFHKNVVVTGFEPSDVMEAILMLVRQINQNKCEVLNQYKRAVSKEGNLKAQELIYTYMCKRKSFRWRGLEDVPKSALKLKDEFSYLDAEKIFSDILPKEKKNDSKACICGEILKGHSKPKDCKVFANACTPKTPIGSCMVSSEGACAAYFKYQR